MNPVHQCEDISDTIPLFPVKGLFLKPISRIHVSVHYPQLKQSLNNGGKTVSSWEIMEKLKALLAPDKFISIRVVKNTLEFIRFEGDLENRSIMKTIMGRLEGKSIKITGFKEPMKVRVAEAKIPFPSKYDWDSFFRDAKNMNEMKAGERPDTIHLQNLPIKWFADRSSDDKPIPSEKLFRRIWDTFGDIRSIDIPLADPYRTQMQPSIAGIKTFTFSSDSVFEAYVQYKDYMSFVKAMDALRGSYILFQESSKYWVANVKVDFDKSKHLSEESIRKRKQERDRLMEKEKKEKMAATVSRLEENQRNRKEIAEKKKETDKNQSNLDYKIAKEERKYVIARRKLESIRLMDYLFERLKQKIKESKRAKIKEGESNTHLHEKIIGKYKLLQETRVKEQHERLTEYRKSKRSRHHEDESDHDSYYEDRRSISRSRGSRSRSRDRSRGHSHSRSRSRERERSRSRSHQRDISREHSRSRSRSSRRPRSRERSRSRSQSRGRSRSKDTHRRSRSRSRSRSRNRSPYHHESPRKYYRHDDTRRYPDDKRHYDSPKKYYDGDEKRDYYDHSGRGHHRPYDPEYRGRGRGHFHPPRGGHFHPGDGDGARRPYRGRGRGPMASRYIGDWEFRDREQQHHNNPNLVPLGYPPHPDHGPPPPHHHSHHPPGPPEFFRGRGSFRGRGRGRGYYNAHQYDRYKRDDNFDDRSQVVERDYTYLEELDKAYEKYFKSITDKKE